MQRFEDNKYDVVAFPQLLKSAYFPLLLCTKHVRQKQLILHLNFGCSIVC